MRYRNEESPRALGAELISKGLSSAKTPSMIGVYRNGSMIHPPPTNKSTPKTIKEI